MFTYNFSYSQLSTHYTMRYQLGKFFLPLLHVLQNIAVQVFATVGIFITDVWEIGQSQRLHLQRTTIQVQTKALQTHIHAPERNLDPWTHVPAVHVLDHTAPVISRILLTT
jgi:hypothetical protein